MNAEANPNKSEGQPRGRVIRVFISSTFRDMMGERDVLVKKVFPELRRKCAKRFVTFTEVDLRCGITEEQSAEGQVLPLCMEEIRRCRSHFTGLLRKFCDGSPKPEKMPFEFVWQKALLRA